MEQGKCDVCGVSGVKVWEWNRDGMGVWMCDECSMVYIAKWVVELDEQ